MAADGSVVIEIKGDADELLRAFRKINNSADGLEDELEGAARAVNRLGDNMGEAAGGAGRLGDIIKGSFLGGLAASAVQMVGDALLDLGGEALNAADSLTKFESTMSFAGFATEEIEASRQAVQDYAARTVYDLETVANTTAQLAANGVADYQALTEAAGNLNAVAGGNADTFNSVAMVMTQTAGAGKLTTENWNQLADAIPGASGKLQEAMLANGAYTGNFRDAMAEGQITAEEFNQAIMQLGMSDAAIEAASSVDTIEGAIGNLKATIVDGLTNRLTDGGMEVITGFINGITSTLQSAGQYIGPAFETIKSAVAGIGEAFQNAFTGSQQSAILGFFQRLGPALVGLPFQAVAAVVQVLSGALQVLVSIGGSVVNFFSGLPSSVNAVSAGFSALASAVSGALSGALQSAIAWGSNMVSQTRSAIQNVVTSIGSTLRGAVSTVATIGRQIVQGLANGIRGAASAVVNALKGVVQSAINAAKAALGIASPSKLFMQFGEWTSEGYAIGVESGIGLATRAIDKLTSEVSEMERKAAEKQAAEEEAEYKRNLQEKYDALKKAEVKEREKLQQEIAKLEDDWNDKQLQKQKEALEDRIDAIQEYVDEYEGVMEKASDMSGELSDFDLFTNDDGDMHLWSLQPMIDSINAYGDAIMALKERGIADTLLTEILGMDRADATAFANELLGMADEQYNGYMDLWKQKEDAAQRVAQTIYASEVEAINAEYSEKLPDVLGESAQNAMGAFSENLAEAGQGAVNTARSIADAVIAEIERINAAQRLQSAVLSASGSFGGQLGAKANNAAEAKSASASSVASKTGSAVAMANSTTSSREIVLNINGKEAARALVDDIRSVEDQSPRIVSD